MWGGYTYIFRKSINPEIIVRDGKPVAVILDIDIYEQMLEQIESIEDLEYLEKFVNSPLNFVLLMTFWDGKAIVKNFSVIASFITWQSQDINQLPPKLDQ